MPSKAQSYAAKERRKNILAARRSGETLADIADDLGVSVERVRFLITKAKEDEMKEIEKGYIHGSVNTTNNG